LTPICKKKRKRKDKKAQYQNLIKQPDSGRKTGTSCTPHLTRNTQEPSAMKGEPLPKRKSGERRQRIFAA
jgi:hypothetical protein